MHWAPTFQKDPIVHKHTNLHTLWALSVFGLGNIWSLSCSKIYLHGYYFPSVAVSFCWVMRKTLNFSFFCKICLYDKSFPNHDMMLRVQRANRSSRNNYWREGGQRGARVEGWVVSTPPFSNTSYAPVLTALPLLEFLHHPIAMSLFTMVACFRFLWLLMTLLLLFPVPVIWLNCCVWLVTMCITFHLFSYQRGFVKFLQWYTILLHLPIKTIDAHPCKTCERGWGNSKIEWKWCP